MKIYERLYDNDFDKEGNQKPNRLLGNFELLEGSMNDYSYVCYVRDERGEVFKLIGREVSYENGGTKNFLEKLSETPDVKMYIKYT